MNATCARARAFARLRPLPALRHGPQTQQERGKSALTDPRSAIVDPGELAACRAA